MHREKRYKPRRMQNNPLETKRAHRDKVGVKAAAVAEKNQYKQPITTTRLSGKWPFRGEEKKVYVSSIGSFRYSFFLYIYIYLK